MHVNEIVIAKKYATAFLHCFSDKISIDLINSFFRIEEFLKSHKIFYVSLSIPNIPKEDKHAVLHKVCQTFGATESTEKLIMLLLDHDRIDILDKVLFFIRISYKKLKNIQKFTVTTTHSISESDKKSIISFTEKLTEMDVICDFSLDPDLIAGIRIKSSEFLWEKSIKKQLCDIRHKLVRKGFSC